MSELLVVVGVTLVVVVVVVVVVAVTSMCNIFIHSVYLDQLYLRF